MMDISRKTIATLEASKIKLSDFHTFGSPCYVLNAHLQSGLKAIPKWEPRAWLDIYVGRSPSHASNVSLILNPRTRHVLPQFHVVYDADFTTVSYLQTATVPPHWAELVSSLIAIPIYTEKQVGTWQLIPDIEAEDGDFSSQTKLSTTFNPA
jgi:hypothetical protein